MKSLGVWCESPNSFGLRCCWQAMENRYLSSLLSLSILYEFVFREDHFDFTSLYNHCLLTHRQDHMLRKVHEFKPWFISMRWWTLHKSLVMRGNKLKLRTPSLAFPQWSLAEYGHPNIKNTRAGPVYCQRGGATQNSTCNVIMTS